MSLANWNKNNILKFSIDHTKIDKDLTDFPILLNLSTESGQNDYDCSDIFDELNYTNVDDNFTGNNGDAPNVDLWKTTIRNGETITIQNNKLKFTGDGTLTFGQSSYIKAIYKVTGNFDLQYTYNIVQKPTSNWIIELNVGFGNSAGYIRRQRSSNNEQYAGRCKINGSNQTFYTTATTDISGYLRLTRTETTFKGMFSNNNIDWTTLWSYTSSPEEDVIYLRALMYSAENQNTEITIDDFKLNSGTIVWPNSTHPNNKKIAIVYPSVQEHYVTVISGTQLITYIHGEQEQLFCEIENWDQANKSAQLWVKVPRVLSNQPTDLFLYYDKEQEDNTYYIGDTSSTPAQNVWDDNFVAVYHMAQDPSGTAPQILNSAGIINYGTSYGSMTSDDLVNGLVGNGIKFDGSDDYFNCGYSSDVDITDTLTLEVMFEPTITLGSASTNRVFINRQNHPTSGEDSYAFFINGDGELQLGSYGGNIQSTINTWDAGVWYYVAGTYKSTGLTGDLFVNGIAEVLSTDNYDTMNGSNNNLLIGYGNDTGTFISATIQEVRISNIARSSNWIKATNYTLKDNLTTIQKADIYNITGYVKELGQPVQRLVCLYDRTSGELIDKIMSLSTGYYTLKTTSSGLHNLVCYDAKAAPDFDDLLISKVTPSEIIK
jgi:hypothetical protein